MRLASSRTLRFRRRFYRSIFIGETGFFCERGAAYFLAHALFFLARGLFFLAITYTIFRQVFILDSFFPDLHFSFHLPWRTAIFF